MGGALVAMPLGFKQSSICVSSFNQAGLLFWLCSLCFVVVQLGFWFAKLKIAA